MFDFLRGRRAQLTTALLLLQAGVYYSVSRTEYVPPTPAWSLFPARMAQWRMVEESAIDQETLDKLRPDDYINRTYVSSTGSEAASLFVGYFRTRRTGGAPHSPQWCLPGAGWRSVSASTASIDVPGDPSPLPFNEYVVEKGDARLVVVYWYHQGKRVLTGEVAAQWYAVPDMLFHGRTDTALVRIITPVRGADLRSAKDTAARFAREMYPLIRAHIP